MSNPVEIKDLQVGQIVYECQYGKNLEYRVVRAPYQRDGGWACNVVSSEPFCFGHTRNDEGETVPAVKHLDSAPFELFCTDDPIGSAYGPRLYDAPHYLTDEDRARIAEAVRLGLPEAEPILQDLQNRGLIIRGDIRRAVLTSDPTVATVAASTIGYTGDNDLADALMEYYRHYGAEDGLKAYDTILRAALSELTSEQLVQLYEDPTVHRVLVAADLDEDEDEDDSTTEECQDCGEVVDQDEPYFATPCGTFCSGCMEKHVKECGVCASEFRDDFDEEE